MTVVALILLADMVFWNIIINSLWPDSWQSKVSLAMTLVFLAMLLTMRKP